MINKTELLKYLDFFQDKRSLRRFIAYTVGPFVCAVVLFYVYAKIVAPPPDEIIRGFLVTIFITPLVAIPYATYVLNLQYRLHETHDFLNQLVREDPLTQLLNRRGFYEEISNYGDRPPHKRHKREYTQITPFNDTIKMKHGALLILDIDDFKGINDEFGHDVGDEVLVKLADVLSDSIRQEDLVARIGGEEFAIFLGNADIDNILIIFERIQSTLKAKPIYCANNEIFISVSCGVAVAYQETEFNKTYKAADEMLYIAKRSGKNRMYINKNSLSLLKPNYDQYPSALFA